MPNGYIYDQAAMSRSEAILGAEINTDDPVYDQPPLSRIEYLLKTLEEQTSHILRIKDVVPSVSDLPATGNEDGDLYFVGPNEDETYDEYVYVEEKGEFEKLGSTDIDISQFVLKAGDTMTGTLYNKHRRGLQYGYNATSGMYAVELDTISAGMGMHVKLRNLPNENQQEVYNVHDALSIILRENGNTPGVFNFLEVVLRSGMHGTPSYNAVATAGYVDQRIAASFEANLLDYIDNHIKTQAEYDQLQDKTGFWFIKDPVT